jgi:Protein of unknown function (DUF1553)/Protein of unknown function (DUF1549)/Planctomycete cytochrome C/F5/8 type C domain
MIRRYTFLIWGCLIGLGSDSRAEDRIDFNRQIRPLLSNRCFTCHGPDQDERKADLRLDTREGALASLGSHAAVVPGNPDDSELLVRVALPAGDEDIMPPADKGKAFTPEEVALIRRWIEQDAPYAAHWSYLAPTRPGFPDVSRPEWVREPLDRFVLARLDAEGLSPSPEADRTTLARRLALDLIGLPPSSTVLQPFLEDLSEDAYERYVDSLLADPAFGERWGRVWLDLARYADSAGYADDPPRTIWAYRDYVIDSLNANMPFDQFTIEQIAGDLLPNPSDAQLIATAFHRNTLTNNEGGTNDEEFRNVAIVDRVSTTMAVWMGTTMACAQCHTHKFDPLTHAEFFQMFDFFNQSQDADKKDESPLLEVWTDELRQKKADLQTKVESLGRQTKTLTPSLEQEHQAWLAGLRAEPVWEVLTPSAAKGKQSTLTINPEGWVRHDGAIAERDTYELSLPIAAGQKPITALQLAVSAEQSSNFVVSQMRAEWRPAQHTSPQARYVRITVPGEKRFLQVAELEIFAEGKNIAPQGKASLSSVYTKAAAAKAIDGNTDGAFSKGSVAHSNEEKDPWLEIDLGSEQTVDRLLLWNRTDGNVGDRIAGYRIELFDGKRAVVWEQAPGTIPAPSVEIVTGGPHAVRFAVALASYEQSGFPAPDALTDKVNPEKGWAIAGGTGHAQELTLIPAAPIPPAAGTLQVTIAQESVHAKHLLKHFRMAATREAEVRKWATLPGDIRRLVQRPQETRSADEEKKLSDYFLTIAPGLAATRKELAAAEKSLAEFKPLTTVPIMRDLAEDKRRETRIHLRGNYLSLGDTVTAGVPAAFHPLPEGVKADRLALAHWLVDERNPLTARVTANRHWEEMFGIGIVETSEEFGSQGELPSHPELLDWLAMDLQENGWDLKRMLKSIALSATYRQSSRTTPEMQERDPNNRLLSRGPRFRVSAEMVRDQTLAIAGLLSRKQGGMPVNPPQPEMGLKAAFGGATDWKTSTGEDKYRRALYTSWRRSNPYPSMATFDAPNREVCTVRRGRTNTPLQALVTLNDPVYVEAAQAFAREIVREGGAEVDSRIRYAFRKALLREPSDAEMNRLESLVESVGAAVKLHPDEATKLATDPLGPAPDGSDVQALATWSVVANVVLNLDEMLMKR